MSTLAGRLSRLRLSEGWCLPVALATVTCFYGRLLAGDVLYSSDILPYVLGQKHLIREALWGLRLPAYDPYTLCGSPLLSNITAGVLYPLNVLLLFGTPLWGIQLFVFAHYVGATAAFYALLRRGLDLSGWPAATGALAYAVGGYAWSMSDHWHFACLPWTPLFFLGLIRILRHRLWDSRRWWMVLSSGSLTMLFLSGSFQQAYDTVAFGGILTLIGLLPAVRNRHWRDFWRLSALYAAVVLCAVLLAFPQLLPTALAARRSYRAGGIPSQTAQRLSFPPKRLAEFMIPFMFGPRDDYGNALREHYGGSFPWAQSLFVGIALLAAAGATVHRDQPDPVRWAWGLCVLGLCLSCGKYLPFYGLAHACLPGFNVFRHPEKYLFWVHFAVCLLGAKGLDETDTQPGGRRLLCALAAAIAIVAALTAGIGIWAVLNGEAYAEWLRAGGTLWTPSRFLGWHIRQGTASLVSALGCAGLLLRRLSRHTERPGAFVGPVFVITFCHLAFVGGSTTWTVPRPWIEEAQTATAFLPDDSRGGVRIFVDDTKRAPLDPNPPRPVFVWERIRAYVMLTINTPSLFGVHAASGFSPLAPADYLELIDFQRHNPLIIADVCAARYVIVDGELNASQIPPGNTLLHLDRDAHYTILENPTAYPRIYTTGPACTIVEKEAAAERAFRDAEERHRVAAGHPLPPPTVTVSKTPDHFVQAGRKHTPGLTVKRDSPGDIEVECSGPCWLVVRDWRHPGWGATIDGRQNVEVTAVDGNFMGVFVPVGRHTVTLAYHTPGLPLGIVMSVLGCLLLAAVWLDPLVLLDTLHTKPRA